jgi:hypothetical protein
METFALYGQLLPEMQAEVRRHLTYRGRIWLSWTCKDEMAANCVRSIPSPMLYVFDQITQFSRWSARRETLSWFDEMILTPLDALVDLSHGEPFIMDAGAIWETLNDVELGTVWRARWARIEFRPRMYPNTVGEVSHPGDLWLTIPLDSGDSGPWRVDRFAGPRAVPSKIVLALRCTRTGDQPDAMKTDLADLQAWLRERRAVKDLAPYVPDAPPADSDSDSD